MTPVERIEALYQELLTHYADGEDREIRAAAKLLLVALDRFRRFGGPNWDSLVDEYLDAARERPEEFEAMLRSNRAPPEQLPH
jgi:hypothetical protein